MIQRLQEMPFGYRLSQVILGGFLARSKYVKEYVKPKVNDKILDIGCGTADILKYLPQVDYCGFDMNEKYIHSAIKRFGNRGRFICKKISKDIIQQLPEFDIVMANGILHHLNDDGVLQLLGIARSALKPEGRFFTLDGCYADNQFPIARYFLKIDRGKYIRTKEGYSALVSKIFKNVKFDICHDLFRVPYTVIIMECRA